jgi:translocation and assembly module TamB
MADPVALAPAPAVKKKRWGRRLAIAFLLLLVLLVAGVWAAPGLIARSSYRHRLIADATKDLNGKVEVGAVSLAWLHPVELFDVAVTDPDGRPVLTAAKVSTSRTLLDFARDRSDLGTIRVERLRAEVVVENGTTNVERVIANYLKDAGTPPPPDRTPIRIEVTDGTVVLIDPTRNETRQLDAVTATVGVPKSRSEPVTLAVATKAAGELKADCMFGDGGTVKLTAAGFDAADLGPVLRRFDPAAVAAGTLTADLSAEWKPGAVSANGTASVSGLSLGGAWLGPDVLKLQSAQLTTAKFSYAAGKLTVESAKLACDAGTAEFAGSIDTAAPDKLLDQTGLKLDADVDVAVVARLLPTLLRVKPGTELTSGRLTVKAASAAGPTGPTWAGSVSTTRLEGKRDGKSLVWDKPLAVTFQGRVRPDGLPMFDDLTVASDFIGARARGEPEQFTAAVNLELDKLAAHLHDFLDLDLQLGGSVRNLIVRTHPKAGGGYTLTADGAVTNLVVLDKAGTGIREPSLTLKANADGDLLKRDDRITGARIDTGTVTVTAGSDVLDVALLEPIADAKALASGKARVNLTGDLGRWRSRVGPLVGFPAEWDLGGTARQASAVVTLGEVISARQVKLSVANAVFRGAGLDISEPLLGLETSDQDGGAIAFDRKTGVTAFTFTSVTCETVRGAADRFEIRPSANGEYGASGRANVVARLDRLQRTLKLQSDPTLADQFRGTAEGTVALNAPTFDRLGLTGDLTITGFEFGPPNAPTWTEQKGQVQAKFDGEYAVTADTLNLRSATVERDGLTATGKGSVSKLTTAVDLDLSGDLTYDLAKLEPQLKKYLGKTATAAGRDTKPYRIAGNLTEGGKSLTAIVGGKPAHGDLTQLSGNAAVAWTALKAYGFDVSQSEIKATVGNGLVTMTPVQATFGGGKIRVEPTVRLNPGAYDLTFQKGRIIDNAKLTPAACADAVGYALPALANSAQADGTVSFDLGDHRIPLADPTRGVVKGNLTVHDATVSPGPVVTELIEVFGLAAPKLQVKKNSVVPVRMENGRVYHSDFVFNVGNTPVTTAGSVGTDGTLDMTVSVPIGSTLAEKLVPGNRPLIHKALAGQSITVAIGGTLQKPTLNREAMKGQLTKVVQGAMKDAAKDAVKDAGDDLLKKGLDGLFKKK